MWIQRTLESRFSNTSKHGVLPVWLLLGPRQVGKSALLLRCKPKDWLYVNLDDPDTRARANADPILFSKDLGSGMVVDEIQYAPKLLSAIKMLADADRTPGSIWLTGSQSFEVMKGVEESLAGRVAILNLYGLTDEEKRLSDASPKEYFAALLATGFPALQAVPSPDARTEALASYFQTYVERDVRELLGIQKRREFELFVRACALRTGQVVEFASLARDVGISPVAAKEWLGLLEDSFLVRLVFPYRSNLTARLTKSPKLYFLDAGFAAFLCGWRDPEMARLGPMAGALYETHVFSLLYRHFTNRSREPRIFTWRTKDRQEIDFLVESGRRITPIEAKLGRPDSRELPWTEKLGDSVEPGIVLSLAASLGKQVSVNDHWRLAHPLDLPKLGLD